MPESDVMVCDCESHVSQTVQAGIRQSHLPKGSSAAGCRQEKYA